MTVYIKRPTGILPGTAYALYYSGAPGKLHGDSIKISGTHLNVGADVLSFSCAIFDSFLRHRPLQEPSGQHFAEQC